MDPVLVSSADIEQIPILVQIGLLCVQSDPQARPDMDRVVMLLSRKLRHIEEPSRPGVPGSRFRRYRTGTTSSATGNSYGSNSGSFGSTNLLSASSSGTSSSLANTQLQRHGKRPVKDQISNILCVHKLVCISFFLFLLSYILTILDDLNIPTFYCSKKKRLAKLTEICPYISGRRIALREMITKINSNCNNTRTNLRRNGVQNPRNHHAVAPKPSWI